MINVLFITNESELTSCALQSLIVLLENLPRTKVRPFVIVPEQCNIEQHLKQLRVKYFIMPFHSHGISNFFANKNDTKKLIDIIDEYNIDIIHSDDINATHIANSAKQKIDVELVWHINSSKSNKHDNKLIDGVDAVITTAKPNRNRFNSSHYHKIHLIYNSINCDFYKPVYDVYALKIEVNLQRDEFIIIFVGFIEEEQGVFDLFDAALNLHKKDKNFSLYFIGQGKEEDISILKNRIKTNKLQNKIKILGKQPDIYKYLQVADLLIVPAHTGTSNMSHVVAEAFACGTSVIGTNIPEINDIISNAGGTIVSEQSPNMIASSIAKFIDNPDLLYKRREKNRKKAVELFDIKSHAKQALDVYYELLRK